MEGLRPGREPETFSAETVRHQNVKEGRERESLLETSLGLEKGGRAAIDEGGNPRVVSAGFDERNKVRGEPKGEEDFVKEGPVDSIKGVGHVKFDQHPFFFSLIA